MGFDGVDGRRQSGESHHCREHHVDRAGLNDLVECAAACINLHVGHVGKGFAKLIVVGFVGYDHCRGVELMGLLGKHLPMVVGRKGIGLIEVGVLRDDIKALSANASRRPEDAYLPPTDSFSTADRRRHGIDIVRCLHY